MHKRIDIAQRLSPFSHRPGTWVNLPGLHIQAKLFPCRIELWDVSDDSSKEMTSLSLNFGAPISRFTILHRLEKGVIDVEGVAANELFRYQLVTSPTTGGVQLMATRSPTNGFTIEQENKLTLLHRGCLFNILGDGEKFERFHPSHFERLSLGNHKIQDWDLVQRRLDLKEIFPIWLRLGQMVPTAPPPPVIVGTMTLLKQCENYLSTMGYERSELPWIDLFRTAFHGIMVPRVDDSDHQGFFSEPVNRAEGINPVLLLTEGARLIRQMFINDRREMGGALMILPHLPPSFTCGRYINITMEEWGEIDMEWSKRRIRRLLIKAKGEAKLPLCFGSHVRKYRLQKSTDKHNRGEWRNCTDALHITPNTEYLLDNFN